jgi:V8-like Glu-specific endopeptidase
MKKTIRAIGPGRRLWLIGGFLLLCTLIGQGQSAPAVQAAVPDTLVHRALPASASPTREYWTPERMHNANPVRMTPGNRGTGAVSHRASDDLEGEDFGDVANQGPGYWSLDRMQRAQPVNTLVNRARDRARASRTRINAAAMNVPAGLYSSSPYAALGKVFFTDPQSGTDYVCSGTAVNSANRSVVDTAGHCIIEGGSGNNFYRNWMFCPQRMQGNCPKGEWFARDFYTSQQWANNGTLARDIGYVVVERHGGQALGDVVPSISLATDLPRNQQYRALGYPAASPFDGEHMYGCDSATTSTDSSQGSPNTVGISCDMTGGSSGGGWLIKRDNTWYLNGHVDYGYDDMPNVLFSPYYDSFVRGIFNRAQNA